MLQYKALLNLHRYWAPTSGIDQDGIDVIFESVDKLYIHPKYPKIMMQACKLNAKKYKYLHSQFGVNKNVFRFDFMCNRFMDYVSDLKGGEVICAADYLAVFILSVKYWNKYHILYFQNYFTHWNARQVCDCITIQNDRNGVSYKFEIIKSVKDAVNWRLQSIAIGKSRSKLIGTYKYLRMRRLVYSQRRELKRVINDGFIRLSLLRKLHSEKVSYSMRHIHRLYLSTRDLQ